MDILQLLRKITSNHKASILTAPGHGTPAEMIIDIVRATDALFLRLLLNNWNKAAPNTSWTKSDAFSIRAANVAIGIVQSSEHLLKDYENVDLPVRLTWADTALGMIGYYAQLEQYLSLIDTGLAHIVIDCPNVYRIKLKEGSAGFEAIEKDTLYKGHHELNKRTGQTQKPYAVNSNRVYQRLGKILSTEMAGKILAYMEPSVDEHFRQIGETTLKGMLGYDSFSERSRFNGVRYDLYRRVTGMLIGIAWEHISITDQLINMDLKFSRRWVFTPIGSLTDLCNRISRAILIDPETVRSILSVLTLSNLNTNVHCVTYDSAFPPLVSIGPDKVILSLAGCIGAPLEYLLSELRNRYVKDWDRAGEDREKWWRPELYHLITSGEEERYVTSKTGIKIREGNRVITDIDAVIFDRESGMLALFQLKWQDLFVADMYKRSSRAKNFISKAQEWVKNTDKWLRNRSDKEICRTFALNTRDFKRFRSYKLFVLGRYFSHFSGQSAHDDRAYWGTWYQVYNLIQNRHHYDVKYSEDPITWLASALEKESPYNKDLHFTFESEKFLLPGGIQVIVG